MTEYCGIVARPLEEVPEELPQVEWSAQKNIHMSTTNGFGKITFNVEQIGGTKPAKVSRQQTPLSYHCILWILIATPSNFSYGIAKASVL